jgi:hypothetical protein
MSTFDEQTSAPQFTYTSGLTVILVMPRPQSFVVRSPDEITHARATSGRRQTLLYYSQDMISIGWNFLTAAQLHSLRNVWDATHGGLKFKFQRHNLLPSEYPYAGQKVYKNIWDVLWAESMKQFPAELEGDMKDTFRITMEMEEFK